LDSMEKDTGSKGGINCIDDLDAKKEKWFAMDGGGKVQFRTITQSEWRSIQKQTVKRKVDYKKVDGTPGRFEYDEINSELQNELFWDASIVSWDGFSFKHPETKAVITCTPESCTRENKLLLVLNSKKFLSFANEAIKELSDDETAQAKAAEKN
jgi:hypothetical protein